MQIFQAFARPANQDRKYFPFDPTKAKPMGTGIVNETEERQVRRKQETLKNLDKLERGLTQMLGSEAARAYMRARGYL